jgi:hypothetical protein
MYLSVKGERRSRQSSAELTNHDVGVDENKLAPFPSQAINYVVGNKLTTQARCKISQLSLHSAIGQMINPFLDVPNTLTTFMKPCPCRPLPFWQ